MTVGTKERAMGLALFAEAHAVRHRIGAGGRPDRVGDGDSISIGSGTYSGGCVDIDKSVSLVGAGAASTTIAGGVPCPYGSDEYKLLTVGAGASTANIGSGDAGGIFNFGNVTLDATSVGNNDGVEIANADGSMLTVENGSAVASNTGDGINNNNGAR